MTGPVLIQQKLPLPITPRGGAIGSEVSPGGDGAPPPGKASDRLRQPARLPATPASGDRRRGELHDHGNGAPMGHRRRGALFLHVLQRRETARPVGRLPRDHGRWHRKGEGQAWRAGRKLRRVEKLRRRSLPPSGRCWRERAGRSRHRNRDHRGRRHLRRTGYRDRGHGYYISGRLTELRSAKPHPTIGVLNAPGSAPFTCTISDCRRIARYYQ